MDSKPVAGRADASGVGGSATSVQAEAGPVPSQDSPSLESYPLTRPEYINAMVHFYRGEMHRAQIWRTRLDTTTNWAVITVAGMTSFAMSDPSHSHFILLLSNLLVTAFLSFEARRYRYFAVYRARVRMLEENFFIPIIRRNLVSPREDWRKFVALDLDVPKFKSTFYQAMGFRIRRNYLWIYGCLLVIWLVKLFIHPEPADHLSQIYARMHVGLIPGWLMIGFGLVFYGVLFGALLSTVGKTSGTDEIRGIEQEIDHWKV